MARFPLSYIHQTESSNYSERVLFRTIRPGSRTRLLDLLSPIRSRAIRAARMLTSRS